MSDANIGTSQKSTLPTDDTLSKHDQSGIYFTDQRYITQHGESDLPCQSVTYQKSTLPTDVATIPTTQRRHKKFGGLTKPPGGSKLPPTTWIRDREDHFHSLDDTDFVMRFRLSKRTILSVLEAIEDQLEFPTDSCYVPFVFMPLDVFKPLLEICVFSTSTTHRIVHKVSCAIASLRPLHVFFPETPSQIRKTQMAFYNKARFPRVIGAIDCTHVKFIKSPDIYISSMYLILL
ncbi:hypothetical protein DMN91_005114 [Ooceraea biroi]|uniref:Nuclease HARBI1 n=1 Tax=Ooceraea biroi TaxID=2015173 RepID=A0A3L8DRA6_OOCBI|nr:hypothetical protein DMN91_005114 [Ooceraea biroi]